MQRKTRFCILIVTTAAALTWATLAVVSNDPLYQTSALLSRGRYDQYDNLFREVGYKYKVPPALLKAIAWRQSAFQSSLHTPGAGRGLLQINKRMALSWARASSVETFVITDLLDPRTNLEVGAWHLEELQRQTHSEQAALIRFYTALQPHNSPLQRATETWMRYRYYTNRSSTTESAVTDRR